MTEQKEEKSHNLGLAWSAPSEEQRVMGDALKPATVFEWEPFMSQGSAHHHSSHVPGETMRRKKVVGESACLANLSPSDFLSALGGFPAL